MPGTFIFALVASFLLLAGTAMAQVPQPQVLRPYAVCSGITQAGLCEALEWVREQRATEPPQQPTPSESPAPPSAAERENARRACVAGCPAGDAACACRCRGGYVNPQGACQSLTDAFASTVAVVNNHERRIMEIERRVGITVGEMVGPVRVHRSRPRRSRH